EAGTAAAAARYGGRTGTVDSAVAAVFIPGASKPGGGYFGPETRDRVGDVRHDIELGEVADCGDERGDAEGVVGSADEAVVEVAGVEAGLQERAVGHRAGAHVRSVTALVTRLTATAIEANVVGEGRAGEDRGANLDVQRCGAGWHGHGGAYLRPLATGGRRAI